MHALHYDYRWSSSHFHKYIKKKNYLDKDFCMVSMFYDNYFCGLFAVVKNWCKSEDTRDIKIQKYILLLPCFEWEIRGIICGTKNVGECKGCHEKKSFSSKINQTLQKASMDKNSSLFKWSACQIQGEMIVKKQKYIEDIKNPETLY